MLDILQVLSPVHTERLAALRELQEILTPDRRLAAVITEDRGYPALRVARLDGRGSLLVGCAYYRGLGAWWFVTGWGENTRWIADVNRLHYAARAVVELLVGGPGRDR
ncbi:hypothetical protein BZB76_5337 [Actinomadura pelletieri DSM 43383]|uniref:Uncharacterized protein n=2 Tax=Actinomadura pelletieri TaxID=111805 RepID=A0A495QG08_9ACTN|nr:hypothetical protein BZB76_5337 [Actinomadura pelletieri DSM 43383]